MRIQRRKKRRLRFIIFIMSFFILTLAGTYFLSFILGPPPLVNDQNTTIYSIENEEIGEEKGTESRYHVPLDEMALPIKQATIAIEDKRFYEHHGFDIKRIIQAALLDLKHLTLKEGASTLTQQYARNLYLSHEKTWLRKIKEAFYTIRLEMFYTKDEILEGYLNTIYYGHGAYGIEAASKYYFGKNANDLTLAEASMLAGIPKGPTYYSPLNHKERAEKRQERILQAMLDQQMITNEQYKTAKTETLTYKNEQANTTKKQGPYFQDTVLKEAAHLLNIDQEMIKSGGYKIYTTFHPMMQKQLERNIELHIDSSSEIEIGAISMNPNNGSIYALVGGRDYEKSPFNRAISAKRMAGSTFKPFLYYEALMNNFTASTKLKSERTTFTLDDQSVYEPGNFNDYYADKPITLAQAFAVSDNIYAVKTNLLVGVDKLIAVARKLGIQGELPNVPSLALGTASVTVDEMVTAYGIIANGGYNIEPHTIKKIVDQHGKVIYERKNSHSDRILDRDNTFILTHLMKGMFDTSLNGHMTVTGASIAKKLTKNYAGKSGTTNTDSWMIGYSPTLVTGIWTGYDDNRPIEKVNETAYAKNIWASYMEAVHENKPKRDFQVPKGVNRFRIDPETGQLATKYCDTSIDMYYKTVTEPTTYCTLHVHDDEKRERDKQDKEQGFFERLFDLFR